MHDYVWLYMTKYDYVRLYMTMFIFLWLSMPKYDTLWLCLTIFKKGNDHIQLYMAIYNYK